MNLTQKRILESAEARMTSATVPALSPEAQARHERMGLHGHPEPEQLCRLSRIHAGEYPSTMTADDISWIKAVESMLEAEY